MTLEPYEPDQVARLYSLTRAAGWEVFFLTNRPASAGDTVQFQTQWWIERQGFYLPAVLTVPGSRGEVANGLRLDLVVDDLDPELRRSRQRVDGEGAPDAAKRRQGGGEARASSAASASSRISPKRWRSSSG